MANYQLLLPKMGESVAEATVIKWLKSPGDLIEVDEPVIEIATDKVDSEVPSPVKGKLILKLCKQDEVVQVGDILAIIELEPSEQQQQHKPAAQIANVEETQPLPVKAEEQPVQPEPVILEEQKPAPGTETHIVEPAYEPASQATPIVELPGLEQLAGRTVVQPAEQHATNNSPRFYSPLVKHIAGQENIGIDELDNIPGSGAEGRLTKDDLLNYLKTKHERLEAEKEKQTAARANQAAEQARQVAEQAKVLEQQKKIAAETENSAAIQQAVPDKPDTATAAVEQEHAGEVKRGQSERHPPVDDTAKTSQVPATSVSGKDEIIEMGRMRKLIADHMVMSKHTSAHVTSFVEADVTGMVMWREKIKASFEAREGEKITFTPLFIEAVVKAIKDMPMVNVSVNGNKIIKKAAINIGMATALPNGNLIVPVIKNADDLSLIGLTKAVNDLAIRARTGKLQPGDVTEGTFTVTNIGTFGNIMGTPIINQPQVAILALGAIKKKPAVIETAEGDVIAIRHMLYLSMSYDHRVVDGALGGSFLRRVADYLENWDPAKVL